MKRFALKIKDRILIVDNSMMIWAENHNIACIVIQALHKIVYVMCMN